MFCFDLSITKGSQVRLGEGCSWAHEQIKSTRVSMKCENRHFLPQCALELANTYTHMRTVIAGLSLGVGLAKPDE